jgi:hypothetical protein
MRRVSSRSCPTARSGATCRGRLPDHVATGRAPRADGATMSTARITAAAARAKSARIPSGRRILTMPSARPRARTRRDPADAPAAATATSSLRSPTTRPPPPARVWRCTPRRRSETPRVKTAIAHASVVAVTRSRAGGLDTRGGRKGRVGWPREIAQHDEQHAARFGRLERMGHVGRHAHDRPWSGVDW